MAERTFICEDCQRHLRTPSRTGRPPKRCDDCATPELRDKRERDRGRERRPRLSEQVATLRAEAVVAVMRDREQRRALQDARRNLTYAKRKRDAALEEVRQLRAELRKASHATGEVMAVVRGRSDPIRHGQPDANAWQEVIPDHKLRARKIGEPGRDALLKAIHLVRFAEGAKGTAEALLDLAAVCMFWAENLTAPEAHAMQTERKDYVRRAA